MGLIFWHVAAPHRAVRCSYNWVTRTAAIFEARCGLGRSERGVRLDSGDLSSIFSLGESSAAHKRGMGMSEYYNAGMENIATCERERRDRGNEGEMRRLREEVMEKVESKISGTTTWRKRAERKIKK